MVGSATLTMVRSTTVMKYETASSQKARPRRTSPGTAASSRLTSFLRSSEVTRAPDARWLGPHWWKHRPARRLADEFAAPLVLHLREAVTRRSGGRMTATMIETVLARAQAGDGEAFRELVEPYR